MLRLPVLLIAATVLAGVGTKPGPLLTSTSFPASREGLTTARINRPAFPRLTGGRNAHAQMALVDRRLREFVMQQENWFAQNGTYGRDSRKVAATGEGPATIASAVQVQVLYASKKGWTAVASHPEAPGRTCVAFVGYKERLPLVPRTRAEGKEATMEGIPACDQR